VGISKRVKENYVNPLNMWIQTTIFLSKLDTVKKAYNDSYELLPTDIRKALGDRRTGYIGDIYHSLDLLLCMHTYRDLQYGPSDRSVTELRRRMKLAWIAYNMNAAQKLLDSWDALEKELWEWYNDEGYQYRDEDKFKEFMIFLREYLQTTIAELAVLYVYLYLNRPVMPLGFMQHLITLGPSGPTLGDLIDIETLTFIEIKSGRPAWRYKLDLLSLTINTRLPSAVAIPRYEVNIEQRKIDNNSIVVELYILAAAGRRPPWIEHKEDLKAPIEEELRPLMQNIALLRRNAEDYLKEVMK